MMQKRELEEFRWKNVGHQYYAAFSANLIFLAHGCIAGFIAPALSLLLSDETPLKTGILTTDQISWIGSINCIGGLCGNLTFGYFTTKFGSKLTMTFLAIPSVIFWLVIYFGDTYYHLLFARLLGGWVGGGIQCTIVLFVSDIANNEIRGTLGTVSQVTRNMGVILAYIAGAYVSYDLVPCIFVVTPILFIISFTMLPNTPQYYLKHEQFQKAEKALKYYKGYRGETQEEDIAMKAEYERLKTIASEKKNDETIHLRDFLEPQALKGLYIGVMLATLTQFTGIFTFISYAVFIFQKSGSHLDAHFSSIIIAIAQLAGCLCTTQLADTLGRKLTMLLSTIGCLVGLSVLTAYLYLVKLGYDLTAYAWLPVTTLSFVIFIGSAGVISLNSVVTVENLPSKIRTVGLIICSIVLTVSAFACVKSFPILVELIGLDMCMMIFAVGCFVGSMFILFVVDETKGMSMDVVSSEQNNSEQCKKNVP